MKKEKKRKINTLIIKKHTMCNLNNYNTIRLPLLHSALFRTSGSACGLGGQNHREVGFGLARLNTDRVAIVTLVSIGSCCAHIRKST